MADVQIGGPSLLYVRWGCRRCGFQGGRARTTAPLVDGTSEQGDLVTVLLETLRDKLQRTHGAKGCYATREDFIIEPCVPYGATLLRKV